jgi:hypothetical protein
MELEQILERLRESGYAPRFAAPLGTKPPAPLTSPPPPPVRLVGRRKVKAGGG